MARRNFAVAATNNANKPISADWVNDLDEVLDRGVAATPQDFYESTDGHDGFMFERAIAYLKSIATDDRGGFYKASGDLLIPDGAYSLQDTTLDITHTFRMRGENSNGLQGNSSATKLTWANGVAAGIRTQRYNTSGSETVDPGTHYAGDGFALEGVRLVGGYSGTESESHGIHAKTRFQMRNVVIDGFSGDGIKCNAGAGVGAPTEGNANNAVMENVFITGCRDGLSRQGGDANAWIMNGLDTTGNRRWGRFCNDFLGGTEMGGHSADNGLVVGSIPTIVSHNGNRYAVIYGQDEGASTNAPTGTTANNTWWKYMAAGTVAEGLNIPAWVSGITVRAGGAACYPNANAQNVILGPYSEGGQAPIYGVSPTLIIGGSHGYLPWGGLVHLTARFGGLLASQFMSLDAATLSSIAISEEAGLQYSHPTNGDYTLEWINGDLAWTALRSGITANWGFALTGEATARDIGARRMDFPNGYGMGGTLKNLVGEGSPEGVITAKVGSLYQRTDGGAATCLYIKESGTGNTGWVAK